MSWNGRKQVFLISSSIKTKKQIFYIKEEKLMKVAVTWEMCGYVEIEADTMEEAMEKFRNESEYIELPDGEYVDGSFQLTSEDVEGMEAMAE